IKKPSPEEARTLLLADKTLTSQKHRDPTVKFATDVELDSYAYIGAYIGSLTALQLAILCGQDAIAKDVLERTLKEDLDIVCGGGNTALHLATFLGAQDIVRSLLELGANPKIHNAKGFAPVDVVDDPEMRSLFVDNAAPSPVTPSLDAAGAIPQS
ncbi:CAP-Gly domain-containing linker protein 4, partial [Thoreauomyces humboldtii]